MNAAWMITGAAGVLSATNVGVCIKSAKTAGRIRGDRQAREDDHRRALEAIYAEAGVPAPEPDTGEAAGEDTGACEDVAPDVAQPVIGLRAWQINYGGFLQSYGNFHWSPRETVTSRCDAYRSIFGHVPHEVHAAPGKKCSCGIYAAKRELEIQYQTKSGPFAWGRVALWGRVEEAEKGYRAQYAYPVSLTIVNCERAEHTTQHGTTPGRDAFSDEEMDELRDQLALHYGIPVRIGTLAELDQLRRGNYEAMGIPAEIKELVG